MIFKNFTRSFYCKLLLSTLFIPTFTRAEINTAEIVNTLPAGTNVSFIAKNLDTNRIIAQYQSDIFMLPASTQKVFTALAAKLALEEDFRFQTAILTDGSIKNGVLKGNLIIRFSGDPRLTSDQLYQLIGKLKQHNIKKIEGNLILDTAVFTSHDKAIGWVWNDLTMCFNAPPSAININRNCFHVTLDANRNEGEFIKVDVPSAYPVKVTGSAYIVDKEEAAYCQFDVVAKDNNHYQIKGCMARRPQPFNLSFSVQDPINYGAAIIKSHLKNLAIEFSGKIEEATTPQAGTLLAEHFSEPLSSLLKKMMKRSDNQIADALFRVIANRQYNRPASFQLGSYALRNLLKSKANIQFNNSIVADGSGLSRHNQITAKTMLETLEYIAQNETVLQLLDTFPIAGVDGTISGRSSISNEPLAKNLIAKTGALKGVYNLAGFMKNAKGERIAFVQFINGYSTGEIESKTKRAPLNTFENSLYMALFNE